MKRIISICLDLAIMISICVEASVPVSAKKATSIYHGVAGSITSNDENATGFFYDFNKDGRKEFVAMYAIYGDSPIYYSVYTTDGENPKTLCHDRKLSSAIGATYYGVGVAKKGGKRYLVTFNDTGSGDVDYNTWRRIKVNYYKITKSKMKKVKSAYFKGTFNNVANPVKVKKRTCKISGKKVSYKKYKKLIKSYSYSRVGKHYDSYWKYQTMRNNNNQYVLDMFPWW